MTGTILFLCPHGAAKSVIASALFRELAARRGLDYRAESAGTDPDPRVPEPVIVSLLELGIDVSAFRPRHVTEDDLQTAYRVISIGCDLSAFSAAGVPVLNWGDVPPVSQGIEAATAAIRGHLERLISGLEK